MTLGEWVAQSKPVCWKSSSELPGVARGRVLARSLASANAHWAILGCALSTRGRSPRGHLCPPHPPSHILVCKEQPGKKVLEGPWPVSAVFSGPSHLSEGEACFKVEENVRQP